MNYNNIFASIRKQRAFTAFMTTLVVVGSFSAAFAARNASATISADSVLLNVTDTLATSKPDTLSTQTIKFSLQKPITGSVLHPIDITFASGTIPAFTFSDVSISASGSPSYVGKAVCDATAGAYTVGVSGQIVSVTLCSNASFATTSPVTIVLGTGATKIKNPAEVGSYEVGIFHDSGAVGGQQGQTIRVLTLSDVHLSATVDPIFTFTVTGTTTGATVNGATVDTDTSDTAIDFLTLVPGVSKVAAQDLRISTNARNGFNVTARTDSEFVSANGATIDGYNYGGASSTASAWVTPAGTLNNDRTWGNIGLTTSDLTNTLPSAASNAWVGNFIQNPVTVFSQASSTRDQHVQVGYKVQITDLQEAATDYQTNVVYVATPVF